MRFFRRKAQQDSKPASPDKPKPTWMIAIGTRLLYAGEVVTVVGMTFYRYDDTHMRDAFDLVLEAERADGSRFFSLWYAGFKALNVVDATPFRVHIGPVDPNEGIVVE